MKHWTKEDIYRDPSTGCTDQPEVSDIKNNPELYTDEFIAAVSTETDATVSSLTALTPEQELLIAQYRMDCPDCNGAGKAYVTYHSTNYGFVVKELIDCPCRTRGAFLRQWQNAEKRFQKNRLETIKPYEKSHASLEQQAAHIQKLRDNPKLSCFLTGPSSVGKTTLMYCSYRNRLEEWANHPKCAEGLSVWMLSAHEYLDDLSKYAQDPSKPKPVVTPEIIRKRSRQGLPVSIFIDELDKFTPTKSKLDNLFALINAVYACEGQVMITSNDTIQELAKKWGGGKDPKLEGLDGIAIHALRRVAAAPDGTTMTFTNKFEASTPKAGQ